MKRIVKGVFVLFFMLGIVNIAAASSDTTGVIDGTLGQTPVPRINNALLVNGSEAENKTLKEFILNPPKDSGSLAGKRIAVLSTDGVEEIELLLPIQSLKARGAKVDLVAPRYAPFLAKFGIQYPEQRQTHILTVRYFEIGSWIKIDHFLDEVTPDQYDAVVIPGGAWNPDNLRTDTKAIEFIQSIYKAGKTTAAICHGPLVLIDAGIIKNKQVTSIWNVRTDLKNAGGIITEAAAVVDGNLITSRCPLDLPQFITAIEKSLAK
jgi:protease I